MTEFLTAHLYLLFWLLAGLCLLWLYMHLKRRILSLLLGSLTGLASLVLLHLFGGSIAPTLSMVNILLTVLLGVPGTLLSVLAEIVL